MKIGNENKAYLVVLDTVGANTGSTAGTLVVDDIIVSSDGLIQYKDTSGKVRSLPKIATTADGLDITALDYAAPATQVSALTSFVPESGAIYTLSMLPVDSQGGPGLPHGKRIPFNMPTIKATAATANAGYDILTALAKSMNYGEYGIRFRKHQGEAIFKVTSTTTMTGAIAVTNIVATPGSSVIVGTGTVNVSVGEYAQINGDTYQVTAITGQNITLDRPIASNISGTVLAASARYVATLDNVGLEVSFGEPVSLDPDEDFKNFTWEVRMEKHGGSVILDAADVSKFTTTTTASNGSVGYYRNLNMLYFDTLDSRPVYKGKDANYPGPATAGQGYDVVRLAFKATGAEGIVTDAGTRVIEAYIAFRQNAGSESAKHGEFISRINTVYGTSL